MIAVKNPDLTKVDEIKIANFPKCMILPKVGDLRVMKSKPLEERVPITELLTYVEKKSKQTDLKNTPEPMLLFINDLS